MLVAADQAEGGEAQLPMTRGFKGPFRIYRVEGFKAHRLQGSGLRALRAADRS